MFSVTGSARYGVGNAGEHAAPPSAARHARFMGACILVGDCTTILSTNSSSLSAWLPPAIALRPAYVRPCYQLHGSGIFACVCVRLLFFVL